MGQGAPSGAVTFESHRSARLVCDDGPMDDPSAWDVAAWTAVATWVTAVIYAAILVFAWSQVREAKRLREEQSRPFVVVDFEAAMLSHLTIENIGKTLARDVTIEFDPPLESTLNRPWDWEGAAFLTTGIPMLPPGKQLRMTFDQLVQRFNSDLPRAYEVVVEYLGPTSKSSRFKDRYTLDLGVFEGMAVPERGMPELVRAVREIKSEMHKWTDGTRGLHVKASNRDRRVRNDERRFWIQRANAVRETSGWLALGQHLAKRFLQRRGWL